ncbi:MAG: PQQ-binding-like beta-propeller repeat protein [Pikeienuella sp.]
MAYTGSMWRPIAALGVAALTLGGCGIFGDDEVKLPGERIAVRATFDDLLTSPSAKAQVEALSAPVSNSGWSQTNGSPEHTFGHLALGESLSVAWTSSLGDGGGGILTSSPVVAGDAVYGIDAAATVSSFQVSNGAVNWRADLSPESEDGADGFGGGVAIAGSRLFATTGFGDVIALDAATGDELWRVRMSAPSRAAPAATENIVIAIARDNTAYGLAPDTGEIVWRLPGAAAGAGILGGASAAISRAGGFAVVPFGSGEVVAVAAVNGRRAWSDVLSGGRRGFASSTISDISSDPVIVGFAVVVGNHSGRMAAFDARSGRRVWSREFGAMSPVWADGQTLFLVTDDAQLVRLHLLDGTTMWAQPLKSYKYPEEREGAIAYGGPVLAGGRLLATSSDEKLLSFDPLTGEALGEISISGLRPVTPVVSGGMVFVVTENGSLVALR